MHQSLFFLFLFRRPYMTTQSVWQFTKSSLSCDLKLLKQDVPFTNSAKIYMIKRRYSPTFRTRNWTLTSRNEHHSTENDSIACNHPEICLPRFPTEKHTRKYAREIGPIWTLVEASEYLIACYKRSTQSQSQRISISMLLFFC